MRYVKDTYYKELIQSSRWRKIRNQYLKEHPVCERCGKLATEVHHIKNLMMFRDDPLRMEMMAFDEDNLQALCHDCHCQVHYEMGKNRNSKEHREEYHKERLDNFIKNLQSWGNG